MNSSPASALADWRDQLAQYPPFDSLSEQDWRALEPQLSLRRYKLGQVLLRRDVSPDAVLVLLDGQARNLIRDVDGQGERTIERHGPGSLIGWFGLLRGAPCEQVRASAEVTAVAVPTATWAELQQLAPIASWLERQSPALEVHVLLQVLASRADALQQHWQCLLQNWPRDLEAVRSYSGLPAGRPSAGVGQAWVVSVGPTAGTLLPNTADAGDDSSDASAAAQPLRLLCLPVPVGTPVLPVAGKEDKALAPLADPWQGVPSMPLQTTAQTTQQSSPLLTPEVLGAGEYSLSPDRPQPRSEGRAAELKLKPAVGPREIPLAICQALADYYGVPINRDALVDYVDGIVGRQGQLNLMSYGQILDSLGLRVAMAKVPVDRLERVPVPALLLQNDHVGLLDGLDDDGLARVLEPELGPLLIPPAALINSDDGQIELLLFERKPDAKEQRFNWAWFWPYIRRHKRALIDVLAASIAVNLLALVTPLGMQLLINSVSRQQDFGTLLSISALMVLAAAAAGMFKMLRNYIFTEVANRVDQDTKANIMDQLVRLPQGYFDSRPVGTITYYFRLLDQLREFLVSNSLTLVVDTFFSLVYFAVLAWLSPILTIVVVATLPIYLILTLVSNPIIFGQIQRSINESVRTFSYLTEAITGIQTIKSQNAELKTRLEFQNRYSKFLGEDFKLKISKEAITELASFVQVISGLLVIAIGIYLVMQNKLTIGGLIAFRILESYITRPLVQLTGTWQQFQMTKAQIKMVADIVDRNTEQSAEEAQNIPMPPIEGHVEFINVDFRFEPEQAQVLHNINLSFPKGCFVGMVGSSGSGKSTLLKLLPRFYRPQNGQVLIDGLDINKVELYSLRRQIGVVPQDSLLFDGSVRDNLLLVKPDATAAELIHAAKIACAHDFIMAMPNGYNSSVGERGAGLSGGQRQRLALARAVLQNPRMLILDEATSALDARTERQVCLNLFEAFRGRTVFFITHRLGTVRPADQIVLLDKGAVMEVGNHEQLMQQRGWYYALYQSQRQEVEA
ncbi:MAG: peptidase domain-containing ABC transporter [Cyanobacteriota bacterium]|nr:peptidase domain-containing ABC transporter [Cyanobacteriota bacterium]